MLKKVNGIFNIMTMEGKIDDPEFCCFVSLIYDLVMAYEGKSKCKIEELYNKALCLAALFMLDTTKTDIIEKLRERAKQICNCDC